MPVKLQPTSVIKTRLGINPNGRVQKFFTNTCYKHMDKYVPMSDLESKGDLRTIVDIQSNSITYESPYAHYQYIGMRKDGTRVVKNYTTEKIVFKALSFAESPVSTHIVCQWIHLEEELIKFYFFHRY